MKINLRSLAVSCVVLLSARTTSAESPNIILILTDDQGWSQMSVSMDPDVADARSLYLETPGMARLVEQGMRFPNGYSPAPLCTPTRRSILCGTSAARSGPEFRSKWVPKDHMTIPRALKSVNAEYRCAHFGKWGEQMISTPSECGYDVSDGMTGNNTGGMPRSLGIRSGRHEDGPPHFINNDDPKLTKSITNRAIEFIDQQQKDGRPFYVQVSYYAQHLSVVTREQTLAGFKVRGTPDRGYTAAWAAMLKELDAGIGRLIDAADKPEFKDNTWIFFTADNGGRGTVPGGNTKRPATNIPLTGAKHSLYEGGVRVPFVVRGPGVTPGSVCRTPVVGYDFLPTFYDLAGGDTRKVRDEVDGVSLKPMLQDPQSDPPRRKAGAIIFHRPARLFSAARNQTHKLMLHWNRDGSVSRRELFDLTSNPTEDGRDVVTAQGAIADELEEQLMQFLKQVDADKPPAKSERRKKKKKGVR